jgi:hypothetical protein
MDSFFVQEHLPGLILKKQGQQKARRILFTMELSNITASL